MNSSTYLGAAIASDDLGVLAEVAMLRCPSADAESHRIARMRSVLEAEDALARALEAHVHWTLINVRGSLGVSDLGTETSNLSAALERYGVLVRQVASEYRRFIVSPGMPLELLPGAAAPAQRRVG